MSNSFINNEILAALVVFLVYLAWKKTVLTESEFFARQRWTVGYVVLLPIGVNIATTLVLFLCRQVTTINYATVLLIATVLNLLGIGLFFSFMKQAPEVAGFSRLQWVPLTLVGVQWTLPAIFVIYLGNGVLFLTPSLKPSTFFLQRSPNSFFFTGDGSLRSTGALIVQCLCAVLITVMEEIKYRGLLYGALRKKLAPISAMLVSATVFMAMHTWVDPRAIIAGLVTAYLYEKYHSLTPGLVFHVGWKPFFFTSMLVVTMAWLALHMSCRTSLGPRAA